MAGILVLYQLPLQLFRLDNILIALYTKNLSCEFAHQVHS